MSKIQSMPKKSVSEEKEKEMDMRVNQRSNSEEMERLDQNKGSEETMLLLEEEKNKI